ncbi:hypothetical protein K474DRAFT_1676240 [Panus rudis PR-1116 ss-1]|nr:hypothetical protein K474DRAFT_1676240 [Panus rudis PR-1116 ss-1]
MRVRRKGELRREGRGRRSIYTWRLAGWFTSCAPSSIVDFYSTSQPRDERDASSGRIRTPLSTAPRRSSITWAHQPLQALLDVVPPLTDRSLPARLQRVDGTSILSKEALELVVVPITKPARDETHILSALSRRSGFRQVETARPKITAADNGLEMYSSSRSSARRQSELSNGKPETPRNHVGQYKRSKTEHKNELKGHEFGGEVAFPVTPSVSPDMGFSASGVQNDGLTRERTRRAATNHKYVFSSSGPYAVGRKSQQEANSWSFYMVETDYILYTECAREFPRCLRQQNLCSKYSVTTSVLKESLLQCPPRKFDDSEI